MSEAGWAGEDYWVHPDNRGGFEDWFGFNLSNNFYRTFYCHGEQVAPLALDGYQTDALTDLALQYLSDYDFDQPWFHVLSMESPHPGTGGNPKYEGFPAPSEYEERFEPGRIRLRDNVPSDKRNQAGQRLCGYYAMIANLDYNVGRILDWLDQTGQSQQTLVVFFSDHGDMMGNQGLWSKQAPYDESIRIPVMLRFPQGLEEGKVYSGMVSGVDIYPTCAGLCQVKVDASVQGMDLLGGIDTTGSPERGEAYIQWVGRGRFRFATIHIELYAQSGTLTWWVVTKIFVCCMIIMRIRIKWIIFIINWEDLPYEKDYICAWSGRFFMPVNRGQILSR